MFRRMRLHVALAIATLLVSAAAQAQPFRAYPASDGLDTNPCTLQAPCRLLPAALAAVASGGEIWMLDSANYNTATVDIAKSVSLLAIPGAIGSIVATGGPAATLSTAGLTVALRNVAIMPVTGANGTDGIVISGASSLVLENSLIANMISGGASGITTASTAVPGSIAKAVVTRCNNQVASTFGLYAQASAPAQAILVLNQVTTTGSANGYARAGNGSSLLSAGNNNFNEALNVGPLTPMPLQ